MERSYEFDFAGRLVMMQVNPDNQGDWWDGPQAQLEIMYGIWVHMKDGAALRRRALTNFRLEDVKIGYVSGRCSHGRISYRDVELCPISGDARGGTATNRVAILRMLDAQAAEPFPAAGWEIRAFPQPVGEVNVPIAARGAGFGAAQAQPAPVGGDGIALNAGEHPYAPVPQYEMPRDARGLRVHAQAPAAGLNEAAFEQAIEQIRERIIQAQPPAQEDE